MVQISDYSSLFQLKYCEDGNERARCVHDGEMVRCCVWRRMEDAAAAAYGERRWRQEEGTVTAK
jgi:hypothetical protein